MVRDRRKVIEAIVIWFEIDRDVVSTEVGGPTSKGKERKERR